MDELKGTESNEQASLLNQAPSMSVDEPVRAAGASFTTRLLRAALAGLAVTGIGYAAMASSPSLSKSFSDLTGLQIVDSVAATSTSCSSGGCPMTAEMSCGSKCDSMTPYAECSTETSCSAGACPSMSVAVGDEGCCDATGACCASAGSCPSETASSDVVDQGIAVQEEVTTTAAVDQYLQAAQAAGDAEQGE